MNAPLPSPFREPPAYSPALHGMALLTAAATFPLIFMGGLVTSHGAGMSVPDWPNSYGYNMFLFPPNQWVGGILYEHTHRLMATVVGFLSMLLVLNAWGWGRHERIRRRLLATAGVAGLLGGIMAIIASVAARVATTPDRRAVQAMQQVPVGLFGIAAVLLAAGLMRRREPRNRVRWLAVAVLGGVIFQGLLGGLRVVLVQLDLAILHACFAQAFFCLAASAAAMTSRWWLAAPPADQREADAVGGRTLTVLAALCTAFVYGQLVIGAIMRHEKAGLAIPDLPLAYGHWLPPMNAAQLASANSIRSYRLGLDPVTLGQIWLHFGHRIGAVLVTLAAMAVIVQAFRLPRRAAAIRRLAALLGVLVLVQITLGVLAVLLRKPADIASLHVATGALVLLTAAMLTIRAARLYWPGGAATACASLRAATNAAPLQPALV